MLLVAEIVFPGSCRLQQPIVQRAPSASAPRPLLISPAGAMGASVFSGEHHRLLKRLKAGLPQEDRDLPARWPFNQRFGFNTALRHQGLDAVNIQRPRREMVDMTPRETDHRQSGGARDAEHGRSPHRRWLAGASGTSPAPRTNSRASAEVNSPSASLRNQRRSGVKILRRARIASARSRRARFSISSAQQRGENPKWIARQRGIVDGTKRRGVDRHAGLREIVANGIHPMMANMRRSVASSSAVPTRIAPWRSTFKRASSSALASCSCSCGLFSSTAG